MELSSLIAKKRNPLIERAKRKSEEHGRDLKLVIDRLDCIRPDDIIVFVTARNELARLPYFMNYYRGLGVNHFVIVDNASTDGLLHFAKEQSDCSVWFTEASYREANYGVHWLNYLLRMLGVGHWCLTLDPDEFLIYPRMDRRNLRELVQFLEDESRDSFFSILLDMYSRGPVAEATYRSGQDPLEVCPWFDAIGYTQQVNPQFEDVWVQGGVRRRLFFSESPSEAPALNKTVLVKWKRHFLYVASTHVLLPMRLNRPHLGGVLYPTGCILHFKYLSLVLDKVNEELERRQHYENSREYLRYHSVLRETPAFWTKESVRFEDWHQCMRLGLMNLGCWF